MTSLWRGRVLAFIGVILVAFSLRSAVASLSPILTEIDADLGVPSWVAGLIGAAPPVCFAVFGVITPILERRFGLQRLAVAAMIIAAVALLGRSLAPDAGTLLIATTILFAAISTGNVVLPPLIKTYFPDRVGTMTAVYSTMLAVAAFVPPLVAVPVADTAGWRFSLGMWSIFAALAIVPWLVTLRRSRIAAATADAAVAPPPSPNVLGRLVRLPMAWAIAVTFAVSASSVYASFAWLPIVLVDLAGVSHAAAVVAPRPVRRHGPALVDHRAAHHHAVAPARTDLRHRRVVRHRGRRRSALRAGRGRRALGGAPGYAADAVPRRARLHPAEDATHEGTVALSGFAQSVGYAVAAIFPISFALLHEATGEWTAPLIMLGVLMLAAIPAGIVVTRPHTIEDEWEQRHGAW